MFYSNDVIVRQWRPFRQGFVLGFVLTSLLAFFTWAESPNFIPWGNRLVWLLIMWGLLTVFSIIVLFLYTIFQNWLAPPYEKDDTWKKL